MYKDLLIVSIIALLMIGCKQPSANEDNWVPPAVEGGSNPWDNAVEDGKIYSHMDSHTFNVGTNEQSISYTLRLNSGLTFEDLAPQPGIEVTPVGLFTSTLMRNQNGDSLFRVAYASDNRSGSGKVIVYTKDGKSKVVIKVTVK